jgi:hypothetical protein
MRYETLHAIVLISNVDHNLIKNHMTGFLKPLQVKIVKPKFQTYAQLNTEKQQSKRRSNVCEVEL